MGMINMFSSSSYDKNNSIDSMISKRINNAVEYAVKDVKKELKKSMPNPNIFEIINIAEIGNHLLVEIKYPNCNNFEGNKILLYLGLNAEQFKKFKTIDPHFSDNENYKSPFARFRPTQQGWCSALEFARTLPDWYLWK